VAPILELLRVCGKGGAIQSVQLAGAVDLVDRHCPRGGQRPTAPVFVDGLEVHFEDAVVVALLALPE